MKNCNGKSPCGKHELRAKLGPVCFATLLALGMVQTASAAITADTSAANQPGIHTSTNGATVVDINKASSDGVSHNIYSEFNVDKNGVVLNNSTVNTNTQQAGNINGNANLAGNSATVILNEVRSADPSQLNGMVEVAGQSAQVIIANPSGITCNGCGFINTNHASLTTGTPTFDDDGKLTGIKVDKGEIVITGGGMDVGNDGKPAYTDIVARSVKLNGELQAKNLTIVTGTNSIDVKGKVTKLDSDSDKPETGAGRFCSGFNVCRQN
ncbi:filamentous hemagglutinin N-terminal domain-containing protein [Cronobacter dublinensis]